GSVAISAQGGGGAGIDVDVITKSTDARIGANTQVEAQHDVQVLSFSDEDVTSVSMGFIVSGSSEKPAIAGAVDVSVFTINTTSVIEGTKTVGTNTLDGADVFAAGSVQVAAEDKTEVDSLTGNVGGGGDTAVGGAISVPIVNKTTK